MVLWDCFCSGYTAYMSQCHGKNKAVEQIQWQRRKGKLAHVKHSEVKDSQNLRVLDQMPPLLPGGFNCLNACDRKKKSMYLYLSTWSHIPLACAWLIVTWGLAALFPQRGNSWRFLRFLPTTPLAFSRQNRALCSHFADGETKTGSQI